MLNGVDVGYIDWDRIVSNHPASAWVLRGWYDKVEDLLNDTYPEGMPFDNFCEWIRSDSDNFIAEFPGAWKSLYEEGLLDADNLTNMDRFRGDEEQLVEEATKVSPDLGEEVRQKLIEEDRWDEEDLGESMRTCRFNRFFSARKRNSIRRRF